MPAGEQEFLSGIIGSNIVTLTTIKKGITYVILFLIYLSGGGFNTFIAGSADLRTDGANVMSKSG